jgi:hypothetical protein
VDFAPGFDPANYAVIGGSFPVSNVFLSEDVETPVTKEWTLQAGTRLGNRGEIKAIYTNRSMGNFIEDFITIDNGKTTVVEDGRTFGTFDNSIIRNTDTPVRDYQGLQLQSNYRFTDNWSVSASWTYVLKFESNIEGEGANTPGAYSIHGDRPEFYNEARHFPVGRPDDYQKHKVRLFTTYDLHMGRAGTVSLGALYRYDSPLTYSLFSSNVPITAAQRALDPGYASPPTTQTLFYAARGSEFFAEQNLFDLALNYDIPVVGSVRPYFKVDVRNVFNSQPLIGSNTTVSPNNNGPRDALGLPTEFIRGSLFGQGTSNLH